MVCLNYFKKMYKEAILLVILAFVGVQTFTMLRIFELMDQFEVIEYEYESTEEIPLI